MDKLQELLTRSAALHQHLCPRQVLGVRMGMWAGDLLGLALPQVDKRLLTIVETDGCFSDGIAVATNCWVGRRTMRVEDYGKVAATFVDTKTNTAMRIAPHPESRHSAHNYAPDAATHWEAMRQGYQSMPVSELLVAHPIRLVQALDDIISHAGLRVNCDRCGEEILNQREVKRQGETLCRSCAGQGYYLPLTIGAPCGA